MNSSETLIKSIKKDFLAKKFDKFIHDITFPKFKRIAPATKIEFKFPITLLVGPNGAGKSSILHALWGTPMGYSTSRF
jgi:predicted ATPase